MLGGSFAEQQRLQHKAKASAEELQQAVSTKQCEVWPVNSPVNAALPPAEGILSQVEQAQLPDEQRDKVVQFKTELYASQQLVEQNAAALKNQYNEARGAAEKY